MQSQMSPDEFGLDFYETLILRGLGIALVVRQGLNGAVFECDSLVLQTFCKRFKIDFLWMFEVLKRYVAIMSKQD